MVQIGQKPLSGFGDPIGMLEDCHQRIHLFLRSLTTFAHMPAGTLLTENQREALGKTLRYFREAAPKHSADEEESLFPRLRAMDGLQAHALADTLCALEWDHASTNMEQTEIDIIGRRWLAQGKITETEGVRLTQLVEALSIHYTRHIAVEEREIFTAARELLSPSEKQHMGNEMARRRGLAKGAVT
ncbi:MAG: hemerythrin domain-containing protein [Acidobacteriota bacterium]